MLFFIYSYLIIFLSHAETLDTEILQVYVAPITVINSSENVNAVIGEYSVISYASSHYRYAKIRQSGFIKSITSVYDSIYFYDKSTISYAYDNCNYDRDPKKCSNLNQHYLLIPIIEVTEYEMIIRLILYNKDLQIIGTGLKTNSKITKYIKQQEISQQQTIYAQPIIPASQDNCQGDGCNSTPQASSNSPLSTVTTSKPKEGMPLKWEIPHRLLDEHMYQASLSLWVGRTL